MVPLQMGIEARTFRLITVGKQGFCRPEAVISLVHQFFEITTYTSFLAHPAPDLDTERRASRCALHTVSLTQVALVVSCGKADPLHIRTMEEQPKQTKELLATASAGVGYTRVQLLLLVRLRRVLHRLPRQHLP